MEGRRATEQSSAFQVKLAAKMPAVLLLVAVLLPLVTTAPFQQRSATTKLLLVSFDGFRWNYEIDVDMPNLDAMAKDGVKARYLSPAFITITSPCHFTLLTGKYIENHGVIHNMYFNTTNGVKLPYYPTQGISKWWDNGSLPIWITAQRQGLKTGSLFFPGGNATYQGEEVSVKKVESGFHKWNNKTEWAENIETVMSWFTERDLDFVALYFGEPDSTGHKFGPESQETKEMVRQVDWAIGHIRSRIEHYGLKSKLNLIITADHGMRTVLKEPAVNEIVLSRIANFSFKDLQFELLDYGPTGLLLPKEGKLEQVYQALKNGHPHLNVYKKEELPERLHYTKSPRIPPLVLYGDPGYVIHGKIKVQNNKGEHGFDNDDMDMKTIFRAVGPSFKRNLMVEPFDSVHIYALMCELLGISPEAHDGSLEVTKTLLVDSNPSTTETSTLPGVTPSPSQSQVGFIVVIVLGSITGVLLLIFLIGLIGTSVSRKRKARRCK
ncbi:ectonucleotide pyrophosphatase/phosphodiesterase family member 7 isoform X2 [Rhinatrema bivittatum]|uniref:ectonucleotide pyrophosphatase/phosphodiesterase family member 7 isoform X2 n=1 Tax=Rhinatrema bivittatum TaxID=194408 RepID=UPI00112BC95A|nr:ectonucleotide pyrophosphatase/phosphodiesterase family member 7 isoform X2 [Rhinatrema bivittatum]